MDRNIQRRRTSKEQERVRALRRKRARRRRIIRGLAYLGMLMLLVLLTVGMNRLLSVDASEGRQESPEGNLVVVEEEALIKPKEEKNKLMEKQEDVPTERPLLVNKENTLPEDYEVELISLPDGRSKAAEEAYEPLMELLDEGAAEGLHLLICSSYRDKERQEELFDEDLEALLRKGYTYADAYEEVAKETMPPGCSEHSTGLAFDIVARDYQMLDKGQEKTAENKWLRKHCAEYGFILRYPKGKEDITNISYESWHFRYVGKEVAEYIMDKGITLEEYLEELGNTY